MNISTQQNRLYPSTRRPAPKQESTLAGPVETFIRNNPKPLAGIAMGATLGGVMGHVAAVGGRVGTATGAVAGALAGGRIAMGQREDFDAALCFLGGALVGSITGGVLGTVGGHHLILLGATAGAGAGNAWGRS